MMASLNPRIDDYLANSQAFARPILAHLRNLVHLACPHVVETIKWGMPYFEHRGILCGMASFKEHCAFVFPKASIIKDTHHIFVLSENSAMGHFGRLTSLNDLPGDKIIIAYIKEGMRLNEEGIKVSAKTKAQKQKLEIPDYFMTAIRKNPKAMQTFNGFSYSNQKDYVEWITDAKTDATRTKRLETAIEWMDEGKVRNWKYIKK